MKDRFFLVVVLLIMASAVGLALPKLQVYRYQPREFKNLPADMVLNANMVLDSWVKDDNPWPAGKRIAIMVHGCPAFWGSYKDMTPLAAYLSNGRKINDKVIPAYDLIYAISYPTGSGIFQTTRSFVDLFIDKTNQFTPNDKVDIFAHSMGGLIVRSAIWMMGYGETVIGITHNEGKVCGCFQTKIARVVFMGTPQNGFDEEELKILRENYNNLPVEVNDMYFESMILFFLNSPDEDKIVPCDYYSIVGLCSYKPDDFLKNKVGLGYKIFKAIQDANFPVHDGLVSSESAGFDLKPFCHQFKLASLSLNHDAIKSHPRVFSTIDKWMIDDHWFDKPEGEVQPEVQD
ncbi:MAG: hypothetical protein WCP93_02030 [Candidatus Berkelbacteria bacterium]